MCAMAPARWDVREEEGRRSLAADAVSWAAKADLGLFNAGAIPGLTHSARTRHCMCALFSP